MEYVVKINNKQYDQVPTYEMGYNQTWSAGSERDMTGTWNGTILGNFDEVKLSILPKSKKELATLIKDLRSGFISVEYYDHELMGYKTRNFYRVNFTVKTIYISSVELYTDVIELSFKPERKN